MPAIQTRSRRSIGIVATAGATVVALVLIMYKPMHVPSGVLYQNLFPGLAAALTSVALVLIYRTIRVINWSQFALGGISAQLFFEFYTRHIMPYPIAILVGLLAGTMVAALIGLISATLFYRHPRLVMTVATILMTGLITNIAGQIDGAIHANDVVRQTPPLLGPHPSVQLMLGGTPFRIVHFVGFGMLAILSIGLVLFFKKTRVGTAIRASAENADRASLLGINVKLLQMGIWTLVGFIASVSVIAAMPVTGYGGISALNDQTALLLPLTAAVVARMTSMPVAFATALGMVLVRSSLLYWLSQAAILDIGLVLILLASLLYNRKRIGISRVDDSTSWKAVKEVRPTPTQMLRIPAILWSRRAMFLVLLVMVGVLPWIVGTAQATSIQSLWVVATVALSLVVLTGWSGQISLGQYALVAVGAFVGGRILLAGLPFLLALPIAGLAGAAVAVIIGIPALRIRGLFLAATTFAISVIMPLFLFDEKFLGKWAPTQDITKPKFLFVNFEKPQYMYYLSMALFLVILASVQALRKSRAGRVLIALRDNEPGVQSFGIDVVRTRLTAFAISGFIAAFAGALLIVQAGGMERPSFSSLQSINIFIIVVIGGVSSVMGAVLGAGYFILGGIAFPGLRALLTGILGMIVLMAIPGGLTQIVYGLRDAVLRVVAMRQNIVVPSLFADYSPEAWERRLAPLAPAVQSQGLGTLKPDQRYALKSRIFGQVKV